MRKVAALIGCSPSCLSHHLMELEKRGLIRYHSKNIVFQGLKKIQQQTACSTTAAVRVDHKNQFDIIRSLLIKFNLQQQQYRIRRRERNLARPKVVLKNNESADNYPGLSCRGIGKLYGLKTASGSRIRMKLEKIGVLKSTKVFRQLFSNKSHSEFIQLKRLELIPQYSFFYKGNIALRERNAIEYRVS